MTVEDIWRGLEGVYKKGLTKAIGVSNFTVEQIQRIMKVAKVPIHNLQVCDFCEVLRGTQRWIVVSKHIRKQNRIALI